MLVVFWSPVSGQTGTTSSMLAVSTILALDHPLKVLVTHTARGQTLLEKAYGQLRSEEHIHGSAGGMDALMRLAQSDLLTPLGVRDNTESIIRDRLDLLPGVWSTPDYELLAKLPQILDASKRYYDLVFVDVLPGPGPATTKLLLERADLVVVNVNQNASLLEHVQAKTNWPSSLEGSRKLLYCFGSYERSSKHTSDRLIKKYKLGVKNKGAVPRNIRFMDAVNDQNIIDYFLRAMAAKSGFLEYNEDAEWIKSVRQAKQKVMKMLDFTPDTGVVAEDD